MKKPGYSSRSARIKFITGALSLLGISGILYGIGFLILRSHNSFLGIWGGVPLSSTDIAEEGGRFLYSHLFIPASLLVWIISSASRIALFGGLTALALAWDLWGSYVHKLYSWLTKGLNPTRVRFLGSLSARYRTLITALALSTSALLLEPVWKIVELNDVIRTSSHYFGSLNLQESSDRSLVYYLLLVCLLLGSFIGWRLYRTHWQKANLVQRVLIVAQWVLVVTAIVSLPVVYGKLMLPSTYRTLSFPDARSNESLLLVGQTSSGWVVWNSTKKQTEVLSYNEKAPVIIGERKDIFK
jgi:hypothetical protein